MVATEATGCAHEKLGETWRVFRAEEDADSAEGFERTLSLWHTSRDLDSRDDKRFSSSRRAVLTSRKLTGRPNYERCCGNKTVCDRAQERLMGSIQRVAQLPTSAARIRWLEQND